MKKTILLLCTIATTAAFGQKRLQALVQKDYDESANLQYVDSTDYTYNSWTGSLTINKATPQFIYDGDIIGYVLKEPLIHCDVYKQYSGSSYPLTFDGTTTNTLVDARISVSEFPNGFSRKLYEYNTLGQITKSTNEFSASGSWFVQDSTTYSYNGMGLKLIESYYQVMSGGLFSTDTLFYQTGTNKLIKAVNYSLNGGSTLEINTQTLVTYLGNNIEYLDLYESNGSGGLDWVYRFNYNYTGPQLDKFVAYDVVNNIPTTTVFAEGLFTFSGPNKPASYTLLLLGDTLGQIRWEYDADGFISKQINAQPNINDELFDAEIMTFHFQNTAGLQETEKVVVSVFPNPTTNFLTIETAEKIKSVQILNLSGQVLLTQNSGELNIAHLAAGTYIVRGSTEKGSFSNSIVKY